MSRKKQHGTAEVKNYDEPPELDVIELLIERSKKGLSSSQISELMANVTEERHREVTLMICERERKVLESLGIQADKDY